jgi:PKHD-type hydroxylase
MILTFPEVISVDEHQSLLQLIAQQAFVPGRETASEHLAERKHNQQLARDNEVLQSVTRLLLAALKRHSGFCNAFYPKQLHSLLVSRYTEGMAYGAHVDAALMGTESAWRTDVSLTLFLNEPDQYHGGELAIETGSEETRIKLPARSLVCYPTSQLHRVCRVERGERLVVVAWLESFVRDASARDTLRDLATARDELQRQAGESRAYELINKAHTNLLRRWADT